MMKRLFTALAAFLLLGYGLGAQYRTTLQDLDDSETVRALKQHVAALSAAELEGRRAGSEGEKMAAQYLEDWLREYGIDILSSGNEFGVAVGADTVHSRNVTGFLQGAQKLSYARTLLRRSILFVGFGASQETFAGSWYFLHRAFADDAANIDAMVNLDMLGTAGRGFYAFTSSNEDLNTIASALKGELLPVQAQLTNQQPYPGDNAVFYDAEIPSVLFTTGRYPEHGTGEDSFDIIDFEGMEGELEYIYSYVQRLCNGQRPLFRNSSAAPKESAPVGVYSFSDVDVKPMFLNSPDPAIFLERWVYQYVKYPKYAVENGIQGRVLVNFVINEKGEVQDVTVSRGVHGVLDDEAVRVVSASPKWRPGRFHGKKVKTAMTVAVDFKLDKKKGTFGINGITIK